MARLARAVFPGLAHHVTQRGNGRQQTSIGGSAASWDSKGNLTSEPQSGKTYGYSSENLLTSASGGVTLAYDPALRLYQVVGAATTRFAYDGVNAIAEYNGSNALQRRFVFGPGIDEPIVQYEGSGTTDRRFMSADERGSIIALTDSSGALLTINRYDEYGKPQSTNAGRFQYTGQKWIGEAGLYDYKARFYAPHLGIFVQTDPIGYFDSPNLYAYVLNDPVNLSDPFGLALTEICKTIFVSVYVDVSDIERPPPSARQVCSLMDLPIGPNVALPLPRGPGGGPSAPPAPPETEKCKAIREVANNGKSSLPSWLTNTDRWNNVSTLKGELAIAQMNVADARGIAWLFGGIGGSTFVGGLKNIAEQGVRAGAKASLAGIATALYGSWAASMASQAQAQADAIQARLNQLQAEQNGSCPN